jgi:RimJ/RimL family protein N-acetyltransferase
MSAVMRVPAEIETDRLRLRQFRDDDLDAYATLCADPVVMEWLHGTMTREESATQLAAFRDHWSEHGFGLWCVTAPPDDTCLGFIGLAIPRFLPEILPAVEVGWRLALGAWGRGYATEGAQAAVDIAFGALALDHLISITRLENPRSWHVMEKLGMTLERKAVHAEHGTELIVYGIDAPG